MFVKSPIGLLILAYCVFLSPSLNYFEYKNKDLVSQETSSMDSQDFIDRFNSRSHYRVFDKTIQTDETIKENLQETKAAIIVFGIGGNVDGMLETLRYLKETPDALVVIDGPCYSACTLLLSASPNQVKYTENASFFLHAASREGENGERIISKNFNRGMRNLYQYDIAIWIKDNDVFTSLKFKQLPFGLLYMSHPDKLINSSKIQILQTLKYQDFSFMKTKKKSRH